MFVWSKLSAAKWEDAWTERFRGVSDTSLVITSLPGRNTVRLEVYCRREREARRIQNEFGGSVRKLANQNWAAVAAPRMRPVRVRRRLIVAHSPEEAAKLRVEHPDRIVLCIPCELAFGTGDHATTATCLRLLVDFAARRGDRPWSFMDLGCGTGILALAAACLGAEPAAGLDYDPAAVRVARRNARAHRLHRVKFLHQDVTRWQAPRRFDVVAANLFYDALTVSFERMSAAIEPGGLLIVSGILHTHAAGCLAAAARAGVNFSAIHRRGKWVTAVAAVGNRRFARLSR